MIDSEIKAAMQSGELEIKNFDEVSLQAASYDGRVGDRALIGGADLETDVAKSRSVMIRPGEFILFTTREKFKLSDNLAANLGLRSYYGRKGLTLLAGLQIDPGFEGHLVIGGYNAAPRKLVLDYEAPFVTIEFHRLSAAVETPYVSGEEQKRGEIPRIDKDYLRMLETVSLSDLQEELRTLTMNVAAMRRFYTPLLIGTFLLVLGLVLAALFR
ncbi:dCTP deaminase [bacterium]|nr:dCTP deaminase [bacterium]